MKNLSKQLQHTKKEELKYLSKKIRFIKKNPLQAKIGPLKEQLEQKIPQNLPELLEKVFEKAFELVFEKGTGLIEKTYNKDNREIQHMVNDLVFDLGMDKSSAKNLTKPARRSRFLGQSLALVEGGALGILGIGLPDIPLFIAVLLKGIYEISLSYGFDYQLYEEKLYLLKLIQTAVASDSEAIQLNDDLDRLGLDIDKGRWSGSMEAEISKTAKVLSQDLLLAKFIQGLPIVGVSGAIFNYNAYRKISKLAAIKYKKRYLQKKLLLKELR